MAKFTLRDKFDTRYFLSVVIESRQFMVPALGGDYASPPGISSCFFTLLSEPFCAAANRPGPQPRRALPKVFHSGTITQQRNKPASRNGEGPARRIRRRNHGDSIYAVQRRVRVQRTRLRRLSYCR